eukprot:5470178-Prymnesium_polylepis.1
MDQMTGKGGDGARSDARCDARSDARSDAPWRDGQAAARREKLRVWQDEASGGDDGRDDDIHSEAHSTDDDATGGDDVPKEGRLFEQRRHPATGREAARKASDRSFDAGFDAGLAAAAAHDARKVPVIQKLMASFQSPPSTPPKPRPRARSASPPRARDGGPLGKPKPGVGGTAEVATTRTPFEALREPPAPPPAPCPLRRFKRARGAVRACADVETSAATSRPSSQASFSHCC